jgi:hypothetical protein
MITIRTRTRPRRSSKFVPVVDGLTSRITPVCVAPLECPLTDMVPPSDPQPQEVPPPHSNETDHEYEQMLAEAFRIMVEECRTMAADI